jgi:hypothetical protein
VPILYLERAALAVPDPRCFLLKATVAFFPHMALMVLDPPGCFLTQPVRLYTLRPTIDQQFAAVWCFLTCDSEYDLAAITLTALPEVVAWAAGATSTAAIAMGTTTAAPIRRSEVDCMVFTTPYLCERFGSASLRCR